MKSLKQKARDLQIEIYTICLAYRDKRVPWYAKVFLALVLGYALSPVDLIPDFIPVIGYMDDLVIVPAGVFLALKMIPREILEEYKAKAKSEPISSKAKWVAAFVVISVWFLVIYLTFRLVWKVTFGR